MANRDDNTLIEELKEAVKNKKTIWYSKGSKPVSIESFNEDSTLEIRYIEKGQVQIETVKPSELTAT